ncbi:MAG: hypothetical protein J5898_10205 [Lachnospiraceae bacterium]|nr:hypothetical protein [Lachnospiraceae bacterium]
MMERLFLRNENENNEIVTKIFVGLAAYILVIWFLDIGGIFSVDIGVLSFFAVVSLTVLAIPVILVQILNRRDRWVKYLLLAVIAVLTGIWYTFFTFQMVLMFLLPALIALLYMNRKLLYYAEGISLLALTVSHLFSIFYVVQPWMEPFMGASEIIRYNLLSRMIQMAACFWILNVLMGRVLTYFSEMSRIAREKSEQGECAGEKTNARGTEEAEAEMPSSRNEDAYGSERAELERIWKQLTESERKIFSQLVLGKTNAQIAEELSYSVGTVKNYVSSVYEKTGKKDRTYLILKYGRLMEDYDQSHKEL